jgi:tripartite-type tricarboxylate transporter receptor subunit TctC
MRFARLAAAFAAVMPGLLAPPVSLAQNYPAKTVRVITPWPTGGLTDVVGRIVFQKISETTGQQFIVDNRPGAAGRPRAVNRVPACGMRTSASRDARR